MSSFHENDSDPMFPDEASRLADPLLATTTTAEQQESSKGEDVPQHDSNVPWTTGTVQPPAYRDVGFAIAFYVHLVLVVAVASMLRPSVWDENGGSGQRHLEESSTSTEIAHQIMAAIVWVLAISIFAVLILIAIAMHVMRTYPIPLIQGTLIFSTVIPVVLGVFSLVASPGSSGLFACLPFFFMAFVVGWYTRTVWGRIPYAASNLKTALVAVHCHKGLVWTSLAGLGSLALWMILWGVSMGGLASSPRFWTDPSVNCHSSESDSECPDPNLNGLGSVTLVFLLISYYWVGQVIKNVMRTTVAGTVGTWWFEASPSSPSCCSSAVSDSLYRSTTYSFGSICFGSLVVALLHTLRDALRSAARRHRRLSAFLISILECLVLYIEKLVEYFNKWSFIYVGLYGYGYIEASQNVMQLFQERSWMPVIADDLVNRLLGAISLTVSLLAGVLCGVVALLVHNDGTFALVAGFMGILLAVFLSGLLVGILSSAVDTIVVCYAEAPTELQQTHPVLAEEMEQAWTEAWRDPQSGLLLISLGAGPGII